MSLLAYHVIHHNIFEKQFILLLWNQASGHIPIKMILFREFSIWCFFSGNLPHEHFSIFPQIVRSNLMAEPIAYVFFPCYTKCEDF